MIGLSKFAELLLLVSKIIFHSSNLHLNAWGNFSFNVSKGSALSNISNLTAVRRDRTNFYEWNLTLRRHVLRCAVLDEFEVPGGLRSAWRDCKRGCQFVCSWERPEQQGHFALGILSIFLLSSSTKLIEQPFSTKYRRFAHVKLSQRKPWVLHDILGQSTIIWINIYICRLNYRRHHKCMGPIMFFFLFLSIY